MKKFLMLAALILIGSAARAADVALMYENETAAAQGKFVLATIAGSDLLVPGQFAIKAGSGLVGGYLNQDVRHATLVRLDNDLDLAIIRLNDPVTSQEIQSKHRQVSSAVLGFMPQITAPATPAVNPPLPTDANVPSGPLYIKINGEPAGSKTIEMKSSSLRKSTFKLEVVVTSTAPVWGFNLEMRSNPQMSFWKTGRTSTLNDVPRPVFTYDHTQLFVPLKDGKSVPITVEGHFIDKEKPYVWTIAVKTKEGSVTQTANVIFH